jgi:hypothetical protein
MAIFNNMLAGAAGSGGAAGYEIERSLRFNSADSAYLNRTPGSAGSNTTWTLSTWIKKGSNNDSHIFGAGAGNVPGRFGFTFDGSDKIAVFVVDNSQTVYFQNSAAVFRDHSAWYHMVVVADTTNTTPADRLIIYVNGVRQTLSGGAMPLNQNTFVNTAATHTIGRRSYLASDYFNGYLADFYLIDGQALAPTDFGAFDATTGVWNPIEYAGTFPGNSFHLPFSDNSSASALGTDDSGNGNNWTVNNISVAAGAGNDSLRDSPTNGDPADDTGLGGQLQGNYTTMNPLAKYSGTTLSNGNLEVSSTGVYTTLSTIAFPASGKFYAEFEVDGTDGPGYPFLGIGAFDDAGLNAYSNPTTGAFYAQGGYITGSVSVSGLTSLADGDIVGVAYDASNGKTWFSLNGTYVNSGNPANGTNETCTIAADSAGLAYATSTYVAGKAIFNAGQRAFNTSAPSGFKCLCTANLDDPLIADGSTAHNTVLYTGNGSDDHAITGFGFSPGLLWVKARSAAYDHMIHDVVRGRLKNLRSNTANAEATDTTNITSFDADGFTTASGSGYMNGNNVTFAAWAWVAGTGSPVTDNNGSINSTRLTNTSAGFSIITWTGTKANASVGHGLGKNPEFIIFKTLDNSYNWRVYHSAVGNTKALGLNLDQGAGTNSSYFNDSSPDDSIINLGPSDETNDTRMVAYCFAPVEGYSAFGSYVGNGSTTDGTFVSCGFRPAFVLIKSRDGIGEWVITDNKRDGYNNDNPGLFANKNWSETTIGNITYANMYSNGFKLVSNSSEVNDTGSTYIYAAFAEHPQKYSRAR